MKTGITKPVCISNGQSGEPVPAGTEDVISDFGFVASGSNREIPRRPPGWSVTWSSALQVHTFRAACKSHASHCHVHPDAIPA